MRKIAESNLMSDRRSPTASPSLMPVSLMNATCHLISSSNDLKSLRILLMSWMGICWRFIFTRFWGKSFWAQAFVRFKLFWDKNKYEMAQTFAKTRLTVFNLNPCSNHQSWNVDHQEPWWHLQFSGLRFTKIPCPYPTLSSADKGHRLLIERDYNQISSCSHLKTCMVRISICCSRSPSQ